MRFTELLNKKELTVDSVLENNPFLQNIFRKTFEILDQDVEYKKDILILRAVQVCAHAGLINLANELGTCLEPQGAYGKEHANHYISDALSNLGNYDEAIKYIGLINHPAVKERAMEHLERRKKKPVKQKGLSDANKELKLSIERGLEIEDADKVFLETKPDEHSALKYVTGLRPKLRKYEQGERLYKFVKYYLEEGKIEEAIKLTEVFPEKSSVWSAMWAVSVAMAKTDFQKALKYSKGIKSHDHRAFAEGNIGLNLYEIKDVENSIIVLNNIKVKQIRDHELIRLTEKMVVNNDTDRALSLVDYFDHDSYRREALIIIAYSMILLKNYSEAIKLAEKVKNASQRIVYLGGLSYFSNYLNKKFVPDFWTYYVPSDWTRWKYGSVENRLQEIYPSITTK